MNDNAKPPGERSAKREKLLLGALAFGLIVLNIVILLKVLGNDAPP